MTWTSQAQGVKFGRRSPLNRGQLCTPFHTQWVPGVNNLGLFGRWAFEEFNDVYEIDKEFRALIDGVVSEHRETSLQEAGAA